MHRLGARGNETGQSESDQTPQARRDEYRGDVGRAKHSEKNSEPEHRDAGEGQEVPLLIGLATLSISSTGFPCFLEQTFVGLGPGGGKRGVVIIDDSAPGVGNDRVDQCLLPGPDGVSPRCEFRDSELLSVLTKIHPSAGREVDERRDDGARSHVAVIALPRHSHLCSGEPVGRRVLRWSQRDRCAFVLVARRDSHDGRHDDRDSGDDEANEESEHESIGLRRLDDFLDGCSEGFLGERKNPRQAVAGVEACGGEDGGFGANFHVAWNPRARRSDKTLVGEDRARPLNSHARLINRRLPLAADEVPIHLDVARLELSDADGIDLFLCVLGQTIGDGVFNLVVVGSGDGDVGITDAHTKVITLVENLVRL